MSSVKTITKKDVIKRILKKINTNPAQTENIVNAALATIREFLSETNPEVKIEIRGFGVLEVKVTRPKPNARNPMTGQKVFVPSRRKIHFKPGKLLNEELKKPLE
jgi:integration host factor subunit beta